MMMGTGAENWRIMQSKEAGHVMFLSLSSTDLRRRQPLEEGARKYHIDLNLSSAENFLVLLTTLAGKGD